MWAGTGSPVPPAFRSPVLQRRGGLQRCALVSGAGAGAGAGAQERHERALPVPGVPGEAEGSGNWGCFGRPAAPAAGTAVPNQVNTQGGGHTCSLPPLTGQWGQEGPAVPGRVGLGFASGDFVLSSGSS